MNRAGKQTVNKQVLIFGLVFIFIANPLLAGQVETPSVIEKTSIAVIPVMDNLMDEETSVYSDEIRQNLSQSGEFHVVSKNLTVKALDYDREKSRSKTNYRAAVEDNLTQAKQKYFNFQYREALSKINDALKLLDESGAGISETGALKLDCLMTKGITAKALNDESIARQAFSDVISLNPLYEINSADFPPSIISLFNSERDAFLARGTGSLKLKSEPAAAEVFINGISAGETPIDYLKIPTGRYSVAVKTVGYEEIEKEVTVEKDKSAELSEKLKWVGEGTSSGARTSLSRDEINLGLRLSDSLRVDHAIVVNAGKDAEGKDIVATRLVDRRYRAAHKPIAVYFTQNDAERTSNIAQLSGQLSKSAKTNLMDNPKKYLDQNAQSDPILLVGGGREFYKRPIFWGTAGGVALLAGLLGGILGTRGGGDAPATGAMTINFKESK